MDRTNATLAIKPIGQAAEKAFKLKHNESRRIKMSAANVPNTHVSQSASVNEGITPDLPSTSRSREPTPNITLMVDYLQITLSCDPKDPDSGHVFGCDKRTCDILLGTNKKQGVSPQTFSICYNWTNQSLILVSLAKYGINIEENSKALHLGRGVRQWLNPTHQYQVIVGNVQLSFRWIEREATDQAAYDRNFEAYKRRVAFVAPNLAGLNIAIPSLSEPTPATKIYQGLKHNYQGLKRLGSGAHGDVNKVHDSKHGNAYAIKCLRPGGVKEDFEKEVRLLKSIEPHSSIVQFVDCDPTHSSFVIMEYVEHGTIHEQNSRSPFSSGEVETIIHGVLSALAHIHSYTIIHHDVKPDNILVHARRDNKVHVKLVDFGMSKEHSVLYSARGSPNYVAPEVFVTGGRWDSKIDVWPVGVIALEYLHGLPQPPQLDQRKWPFYTGSPYANGWCGSIRMAFVSFLRANRGGVQIPDNVALLINDMLEHNPDERPFSWEALRDIRKAYKSGFFKLPDIAPSATGAKRQRSDVDEDPRSRKRALPPKNTSADIFGFEDLVVGDVGVVSRLEPSFLVSLDHVLKCAGKSGDDKAVKLELSKVECRSWRIKGPHRTLETYIRADIALFLCKSWKNTSDLQTVLKNLAMDWEENGEEDEHRCQLVDTVDEEWVIVITEGNRMVLCRSSDGNIHRKSLKKAYEGEVLMLEDFVDVDENEYITLKETITVVNMTQTDTDSFQLVADMILFG